MNNTTAALIVPASNSTDTGDSADTSPLITAAATIYALYLAYKTYLYAYKTYLYYQRTRGSKSVLKFMITFEFLDLLGKMFYYYFWSCYPPLWLSLWCFPSLTPAIHKGYSTEEESVPMADTLSEDAVVTNLDTPPMAATPMGPAQVQIQEDINGNGALQQQLNDIQKKIQQDKNNSEEIIRQLNKLTRKIESTRFLPQINYLRSQLYNKIQPDAMHLRL